MSERKKVLEAPVRNKKIEREWHDLKTLSSREYICGYCGNKIASEKGYWGTKPHAAIVSFYIHICHKCNMPTYMDNYGNQLPGAPFGNSVQAISSENIHILYEEARNCMTINAYTAAVMCCRKLLMNIAVSEGAKEGLSYVQYIEFLKSKGFVPPKGEKWIDHIRTKANQANHEIEIMKREDAETLITFAEMLLKFIYEFPAMSDKQLETPK